MKKCGYCGRENTDAAASCSECGTQLPEPHKAAPAEEPPDHTGLQGIRRGLLYVGVILAVGLLYLLSFGPVQRYCGTVIFQGPAPITAVSGQTTVVASVRKVSYPLWVGIAYRPAMALSGNDLYRRYLQWWDDRPGATD